MRAQDTFGTGMEIAIRSSPGVWALTCLSWLLTMTAAAALMVAAIWGLWDQVIWQGARTSRRLRSRS